MENIQKQFKKIGAELKINKDSSTRFSIDVHTIKKQETFVINIPSEDSFWMQAVDVQPKDRHLLLHIDNNGQKEKILCGHDERHWFVASLFGRNARNIKSVLTAKEQLKPQEIIRTQSKVKRQKNKNKRKNESFIRQGEWFFVPSSVTVNELLIMKNEPLQRNARSKPHKAEELYRGSGETVFVSQEYPNGITLKEQQALFREAPEKRNLRWVRRSRVTTVYVRGKISHPDHKTIYLRDWHRVFLNNESGSSSVTYLD